MKLLLWYQKGQPIFFLQRGVMLRSITFIASIFQIHVKRYKGLIRFGLMHVLATNLCVWIRVLIEEVLEGIHNAESIPINQASTAAPLDNTVANIGRGMFYEPGLTNKA